MINFAINGSYSCHFLLNLPLDCSFTINNDHVKPNFFNKLSAPLPRNPKTRTIELACPNFTRLLLFFWFLFQLRFQIFHSSFSSGKDRVGSAFPLSIVFASEQTRDPVLGSIRFLWWNKQSCAQEWWAGFAMIAIYFEGFRVLSFWSVWEIRRNPALAASEN